MIRIYETMFIVSPKLEEENRNAMAEKVRDYIVERVGGNVQKFDRWGIRKLAYRVTKGFSEGDYTIIQFKAEPDKVDILEKFYGITPEIFRWQTFRREDLEKAEKKVSMKQEETGETAEVPSEEASEPKGGEDSQVVVETETVETIEESRTEKDAE